MTHHNPDRIFEVIKYLFDLGFHKDNPEVLQQAFRFLEQFFIREFELNPNPIEELKKLQDIEGINKEKARQLEEERFNEQLNRMMKASMMKSLEQPLTDPMKELSEKEAIKNLLHGKRDNTDIFKKMNDDIQEKFNKIKEKEEIPIPNYIKEEPKIEVVDDFKILDKVTDGFGYNSGASLAILQRQKGRVDLHRIGLMSGVYPSIASPTIRLIQESAIKYAVAQAILDNIATRESSLVVRDLFPDIDLLDGRGKPITNREWIQYNVRANRKCTQPSDAQAVYTTGKECNNERKVIIIWGFENLGHNRVNCIIIKRSQVKTIDVIDSSNLKFTDYFTGRIRVLKTPIMYKARDDARIEFIFDNYVNYTQIRPLGIVVEASGQTMLG